MSNAVNAQGARVWFKPAGSPDSWAKIEEVTSIGEPSSAAAQIDVSHLESTGHEFIAALPNYGQVAIACNFTGEHVQTALYDMFANNAEAANFRIEIPTTSAKSNFHRFSFNATVAKWAVSAAVDQKVPLSLTLQISGGITYAVVASNAA